MAESTQKILSRVRRPRVHITYEVETGGAMVKKELPFVVGVLGDFSGNNPREKPKALRDRKFVHIDRDNFNDVLASMKPGLNIRVENTLEDDGSEMALQLKFDSMEDFEPAAVVNQVEPLRKLLEARNKLQHLQSTADISPELEDLISDIIQNTEKIQKLRGELGLDEDASEKKSPEVSDA